MASSTASHRSAEDHRGWQTLCAPHCSAASLPLRLADALITREFRPSGGDRTSETKRGARRHSRPSSCVMPIAIKRRARIPSLNGQQAIASLLRCARDPHLPYFRCTGQISSNQRTHPPSPIVESSVTKIFQTAPNLPLRLGASIKPNGSEGLLSSSCCITHST